MTLRESLAIAICQAPEYVSNEPPLAKPVRCVCAYNERIPTMNMIRCANSLARADAVISVLTALRMLD